MTDPAQQEVIQREAWRFVQGRGRYVADVKTPGLHHVAFVRGTEPHARIVKIDTAAAEAAPGVVRVVTGRDFETPLLISCKTRYELPVRPVLPTDVVRFEGEAVAAVIAADADSAKRAARLVAVSYDPLPVVKDAAAAVAPGSPRVHDSFESNIVVVREYEEGDVAGAFADAAHTVKRRFRMNRGLGHPLEGRGMLAGPDPRNDGLYLCYATQIPHVLRTELAEILDMPENLLTMRLPDIGGGFGVKNGVEPEDVVVAWAPIRSTRSPPRSSRCRAPARCSGLTR